MPILKRKLSYIIIGLSLGFTVGVFFFGLSIVNELQNLRESEVALFEQSRHIDQNFRQFQRALGYGGFIHNVKEYLINRNPGQLYILSENIKEVEGAYALLRAQVKSFKSGHSLKTLDEFVASLRNTYEILNAPENRHAGIVTLSNLLDLENPRFLSILVTLETVKDTYSKESILKIRRNIDSLVSSLIFASILLPIMLAVGFFLVWLLNQTVTAKQKLQETHKKLKDAEDSFATIFNRTTDGFVINKGSGELIRSNPAFAKMLGYRMEEIHKISWQDVTPQKWLDWELKTHGTQLLEKGFTDLYEKEYYHRDGSTFPVEVKAYLLNKPDTLENATIAAFVRDITDRRKAEEALKRSEARFKKMIKKSPLPMVIIDEKQDLIFVNDRFSELFGYTLQDISTAEDWWHAAYPDAAYRQRVQESWQAAAEKAAAEGKDIEMQEWDLTIKDGTKRRCEFFMVPLEEVSLIIMNDVTSRKEGELAIRDSEEMFRALFEQTGGYSMILKPADNGIPTILDANQAACNAHGYSRSEIIGMPVSDLDDEKGKKLCIARTQHILSGKPLNVENVHVRKDGSTFPVAVFANVVRFKNKPPLILTTEFDISDRKKAETERKHLERQLQQAQRLESIGTLAGGIAHDFNNILSAILGYAEMIRDDCPADSKTAHHINQVLQSAMRATQLVKQILAFSRRAESDKIQVKPAKIIKEVVKMLRASLPTTITIEQDIDKDIGVILADPTQIHQILMNLCTNAFHAMETKGGILTISLQEIMLTQQELLDQPHMLPGKFVQLSVGDTGVGIPAEIKEKIYDPYFTTKEINKGTGMGLAMVHGIVQSYGGAITCNSSQGKGTVFHVTLPIVEEKTIQKDTTAEIFQAGDEHILLVDDEEMLANLGRTLLERLGYKVTASTSSTEALEAFRKQPGLFDLIITDQTMPGMTGVELSQAILQIRPDLPIILCTGYTNIITEGEAKAMGIKEFVMKPLVKRDVAVIIRKVLDS